MDQIETRTDGGATHGTIPGRDAGCEPTASPLRPSAPPAGSAVGLGVTEPDARTHATLEWCCDACGAVQRHAVWQDGRPKRVACVACHAPGCLLVPDGPAMGRPASTREHDVECAACGTRYPADTHGCHRCDGGQAVAFAEGRAL